MMSIARIHTFLLNLLIAQICGEHHAVEEDRVGYTPGRAAATSTLPPEWSA